MTTGAASRTATSESFASLLDDAAHRLGLVLSPAQSGQLLSYVALLSHWNRTYNLTAIRDPREMLVQHIFDCLALIGPLRRESASRTTHRLLDVGSGAGLPGIVVAIAAPEFTVTCVDSVGKKTAFITHAAQKLGLNHLVATHSRVEQLTGTFDVITSRAFASLGDFVESTRHLLAAGGSWVAMKGKAPVEGEESIAGKSVMFHVEPIEVPELNADRCLVWMEPTPMQVHTDRNI